MVFMMTQHFPSDQGAELSNPPPPPPPSDCPRCGSTNTKFCYYNNYNKSQPRHFCKSCKRHWTKGGTLRNIPAGRRRKNKRPRPSTTAAAAEPRQKHLLNSLSTDHKSMSNILFQALIHSSSPSTTDCFNFGIPQGTILESNGTTNYIANPNTEFITFSNTIPTSNYQSSNDDYVVNYAADNLDSTEESTVTTSAPPPLPAENHNTAAVDVADLWRWNEIDSLTCSAWDHNFDPFKTFFEDSYRS